MLQDPNVERYVASATKPLKKEIDKLRTELEELKQAFVLYNVTQQSEPCSGNCGMNYCDDNGCLERKRILVDPTDLPVHGG